MRCEQISAYLPGYAGGDLRRDTASVVTKHLAACASCRAETVRLERVTRGLRFLEQRDLAAPPLLVDSILETVGDRKQRLLPPLVPPAVASDLLRVVQENRDVIAQTGATVLVAAGTAFAVWRALKGRRPVQQPLAN